MIPTFTPPIALIANGPIDNPNILKEQLLEYRTIIAVDGGLRTCHQLGIAPHLIIGDMDSVEPELLANYPDVPKKKHPIEKDKTDLELAILAVEEQNFEQATLFCALKMRTDHSLYNLHLLRKYQQTLKIETDYETVFFTSGKRTIPTSPGQTVSIMPLGSPAKGVKTRGLKWELDNVRLDGDFMSVSNVCKGESFSLSIEEGSALCFLIK